MWAAVGDSNRWLSRENLALVSDIWVGILFWSIIVEFVSVIYFLNLATLSINESILFLLVLFIPVLLEVRRLDVFVSSYEFVFVGLSIVGFLFYFQSDVYLRSFGLMIAVIGLMLVIFHWFSLEVNQKREKIFALLIGLLLLLLIRVIARSLNPFFRTIWGVIIAILITISVAFFRWTELKKKPRSATMSLEDKKGENHGFNSPLDDLLKREDKLPPFEPKKGEEWPFIALALGSILFLTHWLFTSHGIIPRWSGLEAFPFGMLVIASMMTGMFLMYFSFTRTGAWWVVGFVGAILLAFGNELNALVGGMLLALTVPAFWFTITYKVQQQHAGRVGVVAILIYLIFLLGSVFTVTYAYIPGGEVFRENEELLLLISTFMLSFALIPEISFIPRFEIKLPPFRHLNVLVFLVIFGLTGAAGLRAGIDAFVPDTSPEEFSIMTWNIQQGFNSVGHVNVEDVARIIREQGVGIIGLQESDTVRVSSGNRDVVEWLAAELGMYSYYGPRPKDSTFGNALLSAYPIIDARSVILPSKGELAVLLVTKVLINDVKVNVLVAHFGETEEDRTAQANATAAIIKELDGPTFLVGDFNSVPGSPQIQTLLSAGLTDSYFALHGKHVATTLSSGKTIDFIFHANVTVTAAEVLETGIISDHKAVIATFSV